MQWLWVKLGYLNYWMVFTLGHTHMIFHFNQKKHTQKKQTNKQTNKYVSFPAQVLRIVFELDTLLISVAEYRTSNIDTTELPVLLMVAAPHYFLMKTSHYLLKRGDICRPKTPKNTRAHSSQRCFLFPNIYFNRKKHHLTSAFPGFAQCGTITSKASSLWIRHMVVFHVFPLGNLISLSDPCPDTLF